MVAVLASNLKMMLDTLLNIIQDKSVEIDSKSIVKPLVCDDTTSITMEMGNMTELLHNTEALSKARIGAMNKPLAKEPRLDEI
ncbi:hypothetical protein CUMW_256160 [Citrus unshiu]|uniref:Uncharacterized protein n=1 Tax=Citrus unshiu TaxID=55188 RepID=A0A2H5QS11_CITUN|nr:hypothetical protein CUMW_256160 [Citrus unshiu]